jgi:hypothetical protein
MSRFDDKMKELVDRMVAMSPEPPPFPEEVTVTRSAESRPRPMLVFAGAALAVLILAAIPLLLSRGGGEIPPVATTTSTTLPGTETTVSPATTTTVPDTTTTDPSPTTTVSSQRTGVHVFLTHDPENSFTGNPALVPFYSTVEAVPGEPAELSSLRLLTEDDLAPPPGFANFVPDPVEVVSLTRNDEGLVTVGMNEAFLDGAGGLLGDFTMLNQLIFTATDGEVVTEVLFTVGGAPVTAFGSDGLDLSTPVTRDTFVDNLNSVNLDSSPVGSGDGPLALTGIANVFEATVSLEVVDAVGNVVVEDFATASCGTGCWGAYSFSIDYPFTGEETIRVFWHSPEDGSPSDVVTVPVLWDDPDGWDLLGG